MMRRTGKPEGPARANLRRRGPADRPGRRGPPWPRAESGNPRDILCLLLAVGEPGPGSASAGRVDVATAMEKWRLHVAAHAC